MINASGFVQFANTDAVACLCMDCPTVLLLLLRNMQCHMQAPGISSLKDQDYMAM